MMKREISGFSVFVLSLLPSGWWLLPLVFSSFGLAGGGLAARLVVYHTQFLGVAGVSLTVSYYLTYWKRRRRGITLNKLILWAATIVFFLNLFLPVLVGHLMS